MQKATPPGRWIKEVAQVYCFENNISNSSEVSRAKFLGSNRLFSFISIWKFGSFKNLFPTIPSLYEFYVRIFTFYPFGTNEKSDSYELWQ